MPDFTIRQLGIIMEPQPGNAFEVEGVLNPACVRSADGELYLFPRVVAKGNFSRIGICRVLFNKAGDPKGVERLGFALEPQEPYELRPDGGGGCEDPRISYLAAIKLYVMTYVALSPAGPRIAAAVSKDLFNWRKLGLAEFEPYHGVSFNDVDDKDAVLFPEAVVGPYGQAKLAILHRPHFVGNGPDLGRVPKSRAADLDRKSIWISYAAFPDGNSEMSGFGPFKAHEPLASPAARWESVKIGSGAPPIMTKHGWLMIYHGVSHVPRQDKPGMELCYSAGIMVLSKEDPYLIRYRSADAILRRQDHQQVWHEKGDVVFPTGVDKREDIGQPDRVDFYYGIGDTQIAAARLDIPDQLPATE